MKSIEVTGASYEEALASALGELELTENDVDVEVVKVSGLIRKKTTLRVTQKKTADVLAKEFIEGVAEKMGLDCAVAAETEADAIVVTLSGKDTNKLIGYRGDVLDSLQYLTLLICNKNNPDSKRLVIDGENYREKRTITLSRLAKRLAFSAAKSGEDVKLEPMNPFERRIIHSALADDKFVTTESVGEEPNRYVVIKPVKRKFGGRDRREGGRPYEDRRGGYGRDRDRREREPRVYEPVEPPVREEEGEKELYNSEYSKQFKKKGVKGMRTFGAPKSKYF